MCKTSYCPCCQRTPEEHLYLEKNIHPSVELKRFSIEEVQLMKKVEVDKEMYKVILIRVCSFLLYSYFELSLRCA